MLLSLCKQDTRHVLVHDLAKSLLDLYLEPANHTLLEEDSEEDSELVADVEVSFGASLSSLDTDRSSLRRGPRIIIIDAEDA
jgi:hypothetical protein